MAPRPPKRLPPPTDEERRLAGEAALALRAAIADPSTMGERAVLFLELVRPRRGERWERWGNLPGFWRINGRHGRYCHDLLPGWTYARAEIRTEMIPDLEALAERGVRPSETTGEAIPTHREERS